MPTLREDLQHLLTVQEVDSRIDRLRAELSGMDTGAELAAFYNTGKISFDKQKAAAIQAQTEQKDLEMRLQSLEAKIAQVNKDLYGGVITGSRELKNLQAELDMLERQKSDAEGKVLAAMETANRAMATAQTTETHLKQLAEKYRTVRATFKQKQADVNGRMSELDTERKAAAAPVSPPVLARYDSIRAKRKGLGATTLAIDGSCGACHTQLNSTLVNAVRDAQSIQTCEYCGRILVPHS
ncbi:MAG: C4-type zinc ribbon domain-containing protein [Capsulimonadales bacterium]|nr:C4-type zinc ribbon domain-containing protein [Capsulimonadales bacterium]